MARATSKMTSLATTVNGLQSLIIVAKLTILNVCGVLAQSTPPQISKMKSLATILNGLQPLIIVAKLSILDVCNGPC